MDRNPRLYPGTAYSGGRTDRKSQPRFPADSLDLDEPLDVIIKVWKSVEPTPPFEKVSVDEILSLMRRQNYRNDIYGFDDKRISLRSAVPSMDHQGLGCPAMAALLQGLPGGQAPETPGQRRRLQAGAAKYETYYRKLDLYYQFSHRFDKIIDEDWLEIKTQPH